MKKIITSIIVFSLVFSTILFAGDEEEIIAHIEKREAYLSQYKKYMKEISEEGTLEFWSSGGLMHQISGPGRTGVYDSINLTSKHIEVIVLVPGKAAVAMYYTEGTMKSKGSPSVDNYLTRVSQAFVKEDGEWKVRASHWSPLKGGSGTNQTPKD